MSISSQGINPIENKMRTKEKQMTDENTKYLIEFQTSLLKIIANRDQEMEDLKKQLEIVRSLHDYATKEQMILSRKVVEMGYNPSAGSTHRRTTNDYIKSNQDNHRRRSVSNQIPS